MALRLALRRAAQRPRLTAQYTRTYATVQPLTFAGEPPKPPSAPPDAAPAVPPSAAAPSALDALILAELRRTPTTSLPSLVAQFDEHAGRVLGAPLPYESRPAPARRVAVDGGALDSVFMVAHAVHAADAHKVCVASAFALDVPAADPGGEDRAVVLTCAHTLQEMRRSPVLAAALSGAGAATDVRSGTYVLSQARDTAAPTFHPVHGILSSLPRPDLIALSAGAPAAARTLPVSPYPVHAGAAVRAHFVVDRPPDEAGWAPWVGGLWSRWVRGRVLGYRDFAGREAKPGTYDALSHMLFEPLPTPGSSGGPVVDEESGAVVGVILGTRMDNRVEGVRGWGVPAEMIYEMFSLPGLKLKNGGR